jgi:hypothetical protein
VPLKSKGIPEIRTETRTLLDRPSKVASTLEPTRKSANFPRLTTEGVLGRGRRQLSNLISAAADLSRVASKKTQYILTLIDSDAPRDADQKRVEFGTDEVIVHLSDEGNDGRLFKMTEF